MQVTHTAVDMYQHMGKVRLRAHANEFEVEECSTPTERADQSHDILQHEAVAMG